MNVLHINSNYQQSSIYKNMISSFVYDQNIAGRVYYPTSKTYVSNSSYERKLIDNSVCLNRIDKLFYFRRNTKLVKDVEDIYDLENYSVILAYSLFSNGYVAYSLYKKYNIPYCVIVQNTDVNLYFRKVPFLRFIGRKIIENASRVIFISEPYQNFVIDRFLKGQYEQEIRNKSVIIPFGINDYWFQNKGSPKKLNTKSLKLLFVGKVNKNKNITTIVEVCKYLLEKGIDVTYTVVGKIEDYALEKTLRNHDFINYIQFSNKKQLLKIYREHDIFIMTSYKESFGLVYGEAMTQGLPIIYTEGQGFDKHFQEGSIGYSVNPNDVKQIVNKIKLIQKNYSKMSINCIELVDKFKWERISKKYKKEFQKCILI